MALTEEDKAFLIKVGQDVPAQVKENKPKETPIEKDEA